MVRILCFGDSNTYGYDPRGFFGDRYGAEDRWVDLLAERTGHQCINAGANGREIPRNPYVLRLIKEHGSVDIFLVMLGTNDLLQGATAKEAASRMEAFLVPILPYCPQILLLCPPPLENLDRSFFAFEFAGGEQKSRDMAQFFEIIAAKYRVHYMNVGEIVRFSDVDGLHFESDQHLKLAEAVAAKVKEIL